jgi:adenine phosphoribosyltransferase
MVELKSYIRNVPDFPKKGIGFKDITTLLKEPEPFRQAVQTMCEPFNDRKPDHVVGIESRGFIFGGAIAVELGAGFIPIRKPGKLPAETMIVLRFTGTVSKKVHAFYSSMICWQPAARLQLQSG